MSENREEILANFQSITAIDDVSEAILHLEECNWDLLTAIHRVIPQDNLPMISESSGMHIATSSITGFSMENLNNLDITPSSPMRNQLTNTSVIRNIAGPSIPSSSSLPDDTMMMPVDDIEPSLMVPNIKKRDVIFNIHTTKRILNIIISDSCTVSDLKHRIKDELSIPICRQELTGWKIMDKHIKPNDNTQLKALNVARQNELYLNELNEASLVDEKTMNENIDKTFKLNICWETNRYSLPYHGTHRVLDVKNGIRDLTSIEVRHQIWSGWPEGVSNSTQLYQTGISLEHSFNLRSSEEANSNKNDNEDDDDASAEYESAVDSEDDIFEMPTNQPTRPIMLIPDQQDDEITKSLQFFENYIVKYGQTHPLFFRGSLEEAVNEACNKPAKNRKLLAIYLHHDKSVLTNVFCGQRLNDISIIDYLSNNFTLFGWDLTYEINKTMLLQKISSCIGESAALTVRNIPNDKLPAIMVIVKTRSSFEVQSLIYGNVTVNELLSKLVESSEMYLGNITREIQDEKERAERIKVKQEQDAAYKESLEADRAKEEARAQKEYETETEKKRAEHERATVEANREAKRKAAEMFVPPEPCTNNNDGISTVKFRAPKGEFLRSFTTDTTLKGLLSYIATMDYPIDEYKVLTMFPRRDLTERNENETLKSLGFSSKETVYVEERFEKF